MDKGATASVAVLALRSVVLGLDKVGASAIARVVCERVLCAVTIVDVLTIVLSTTLALKYNKAWAYRICTDSVYVGCLWQCSGHSHAVVVHCLNVLAA